MTTEPLLHGNFQATDIASVREFNVVIAYEDVHAGRRAMELFSYLGHEHPDVEFKAQPWRFDLLADPEWSCFAVADAQKADLFIIAAGNGHEFPVYVQNWLTECLAHERATGGAVVALLGTAKRTEPDSPRLRFLQDAARKAGMDFFAPVPRFEPPKVDPAAIFFPAEARTRKFATILQPAIPQRHWGINE